MAATLTPTQLMAMNFGYLTGQDLVRWCSTQLLIKSWEVNNQALEDGCNNAYSEMTEYFATKYDVQREFNMISGPRQNTVVKLTAILAIRDILGNMAGIGPVTEANYKWADDKILDIQQGLYTLPLYGVAITVNSGAFIVPSNYNNLG
jgi:hypothetical protein